MRYAVLADIHGNLPALEAVLRAAEREGVDGYLVAGDLVGYGPFPNECTERIAGMGATVVHGNHDLIALDRLSDERCIPLARRSLRWTKGVLREDVRDYLGRLPLRAEAGGGVVVVHGSLDDASEYTHLPDQAAAQLERLGREHPGCDTLIAGHTHRPLAVDAEARLLRPDADGSVPFDAATRRFLNPGAVGQSRERRLWARYMLLDLDGGSANFRAIGYDVERARSALVAAGLSPRSLHLRPTVAGSYRRAARAVFRRIREVARR